MNEGIPGEIILIFCGILSLVIYAFICDYVQEIRNKKGKHKMNIFKRAKQLESRIEELERDNTELLNEVECLKERCDALQKYSNALLGYEFCCGKVNPTKKTKSIFTEYKATDKAKLV